MTNNANNDMFVKLHRFALTTGLMGELGAERWHTLSALSVFMNDRGECFPSQDLLAKYLNIRRETVNRRIKALCDFRWNGEPIVIKQQRKNPANQRFGFTQYKISLNCGFSFGQARLHAIEN